MILHTEIYGKGEPLLFLHSGGETSQSDYQVQKEYFSNSYQVIMPDLSGHGKSAQNNYESIDELIRIGTKDLYETIKHYKLEKVHIVGSSAGSFLAIHFTNLYPELVKSLCITGVQPIKTENWDELEEDSREQKKSLLGDPEVDAFFQKLHPMNDWKKFVTLSLEEGWYPFELIEELKHTKKIPTLVAAGEKVLPEIKGIVHYLEKYPSVHVAVIPFAGHLVHQEQPQLFNQILEQFLRA
ncbi:alpha/beta hydrolase [Alkalihalobacillus alcalophilus ATCC 27647 = CGMCC 1.3604]|uniref:Alpha/beta hydrolase n=1 Tax=Alkalihalobacillus alcalophilus ATCC 27647 = CGMCC 1.3604 TaxID=1218173 RepID=A0A094XB56_ALKAL|nr:alpha/beta hydrolase [Alkalihalobacillus alcalophilus]KGA96035.1 hypothetical protein BALCAV_0218810 [Alkalihalobacillus alcalophilus ATCC 27647 = CGMCC 1.3604]MED1564017.1 alpha/beta hydrolase [Alkalihalobacillus alcalophilus]THG90023.1 alpha/beta hydrolase [Alkalihalobacillus alcalophilus ATCC 27647 = CGMCC 1.3604]